MTPNAKTTTVLITVLSLVTSVPQADGAMPVVDVRAIAQMASQLRTMQNQLTAARDQLTEARSTLTSLTGTRGMQNLLGNIERNYLPADWQQLFDTLHSASSNYGALAASVESLISGNAILSTTELSHFSPTQRGVIEEGRRSTAGLAALTRQALASSSARFTNLEQLIRAIGAATDPKAIYDLQARVQAETALLQNDSIKLSALFETHAADEALRHQRIREQAIADAGNLRDLGSLGL
jgi:type IV secretion system protein VirB5